MATDWSDKIVISDLSDEPALSDELNSLHERLAGLGTAQSPHLVLNMDNVTYLNSSNIAQLLRLRKRVAEIGRTMILCSVSDQVWSVMLLTGLDKVFRFTQNTAEAIASIQLEEQGAGEH